MSRPEGNPLHTSLFLFDHNCVQIGSNLDVPYSRHFGFDSELPYTVSTNYVLGRFFGFSYSNKYYDKGNYDQTYCYNTGGDHALLPACKMYFRCSTK